LLIPAQGAVVQGNVTFSWQWTGPEVAANQAFEVRLWKEGQPDHYGATGPVRSTSVTFDVGGAYGVQQGGSGSYLWTVAVVETSPYQRIGQEAQPNVLVVQIAGGGSDSGGSSGSAPGSEPTRTPRPLP
jgi:hypothetical protein